MGLFSWLGKLFGPSQPSRRAEFKSPSQRLAATSQAPSAQSTRPDLKLEGERISSPAATPPKVAPGAPQRPQQKAPKKLNLDPGQFAPLTGGQIKARALLTGGGFLRNPWFGRRDLIPPVSDARTALVDRGMVGVGLLTPEQLVEIHEVGAQMERLKPDLIQAGSIADAAVARDAEERKQLKERKKAEAAERKRKHAENVAR